MKLPLLAALSAFSLWGCATEAPSTRAETDDGCVPLSLQARAAEGGDATPSDGMWSDVNHAPRTQELIVDEALEAGPEGSDTSGTGGSGSVGPSGVDLSSQIVTTMPTPPNRGAKFDITPPGFNALKGIGNSPVSPSTGTPPTEGSGGASGR